jgi:hypothetical protein
MVQAQQKVRFSMTGFTQDGGSRVFAFTRVEADGTRAEFTVKADLALSRRYAIAVQELPLLCRLFLERLGEADEMRALTYTEDQMSLHAKECAARAVSPHKKKNSDVLPATESSSARGMLPDRSISVPAHLPALENSHAQRNRLDGLPASKPISGTGL